MINRLDELIAEQLENLVCLISVLIQLSISREVGYLLSPPPAVALSKAVITHILK